jgi:hypothetical protein
LFTDGRQAEVTALDESGAPCGLAKSRLSRGMLFVEPVAGAFSYLVKFSAKAGDLLSCPRAEVVPGETVTVTGCETHECMIPVDASVGAVLWRDYENASIDFLVRPLVDANLKLVEQEFVLELTSNAASAGDATVTLDGQRHQLRLVPGQAASVKQPLVLPHEETTRDTVLQVEQGPLRHSRTWVLRCKRSPRMIAAPTVEAQSGQRVRGGAETAIDGDGGTQSVWMDMGCGGTVKHGLFMHPPYRKGTGYTFAVFGPWTLPADVPSSFLCEIGKKDGSDPGDGILFRVAVVEDNGREEIVAEKSWIQHAWTPLSADLSRWAGRNIRIKLIADVGAADNSSGDWACWADMKLQSTMPVMTAHIESKPKAP